MKKVFCYEWFGINFVDFIKPSFRKIADSNFYEKFYREFYKRYHSYLDLPESYKKSKSEVANFLFNEIKNKNKILSIGCGNGCIEYKLANLILENSQKNTNTDRYITAIEPSIQAFQWVDFENVRLLQGFFPDVLEPSEKFDVAYASVVDYVFNDA